MDLVSCNFIPYSTLQGVSLQSKKESAWCFVLCHYWHTYRPYFLLTLTLLVEERSGLIGPYYLSTRGLYLPPYFLLKIVDIWKTLYMLLVSTLDGEIFLSTKRVGHIVGTSQTHREFWGSTYISYSPHTFTACDKKIQPTTNRRCTIASTSISRQISSPPKLCKHYKKSSHPSTVIE